MRRLWTLVVLLTLVSLSCSGIADKLTCTKDTDCFQGYRCDTVETQTCLRACQEATKSSDCLALQYCKFPAGSTDGVCRDIDGKSVTDSGGGDSGGGDPSPGDH